MTGTYKLEVWGAQGGTNGAAIGGKGGYSYGNKELNINNELYICVGGAGVKIEGFNTNRAAGGYNGGGHGVNTAYDSRSSGGGCTHIATNAKLGILKNYVNNKNYILIVGAGGGGGGRHSSGIINNGGDGGGLSGLAGYFNGEERSGTLDGAGAPSDGNYSAITNSGNSSSIRIGGFGYGGNYCDDLEEAVNNTGGGAGYYGGCAGFSSAMGGGGGSSYIGGVSNGSTTAGQRTGNGYARISLTR